MVNNLPVFLSEVFITAAWLIAFRANRKLHRDLKRIGETAVSVREDLVVRLTDAHIEIAELKDVIETLKFERPNEYELAATYRSLGVDPPEELRKAEAERSKLFDDILADLEAMDH